MRPIDLQELRGIQLEILDDVHAFCIESGLTYSLDGGTLLGAVRHGGYIPWDDDIDLIMPRPDYEYFASNYHSLKNEILDLREQAFSVEMFLKVCRKGTKMMNIADGRILWGINIDIFPIDGAPDNYVPLCEKIASMKKTLSHICPYYKVMPSERLRWRIRYLAKRLCYPYFGNSLSLKKEIDSLAASYPIFGSSFAGVTLGMYGEKEVLPRETFDSLGSLIFEGKSYKAITAYDPYLRALYGDYMQLPPLEDRVSHHLYNAFVDCV